MRRREALAWVTAGGAGALAVVLGFRGCGQGGQEGEPTTTPTPTDTDLPPTATGTFVPTPAATATSVPSETPTVPVGEVGPMDSEAAALRWGGAAADWSVNPDWDGSREFIPGYNPVEWRTNNPEAIGWPQTPEEAIARFYPEDMAKIDVRFIQEAWRNDQGVVIGWHFSEDHWLSGGSQELILHLPPGAVLEGYTAWATSVPEDDRNFVVVGPGLPAGDLVISHRSPEDIQGWTVWMPGIPPEKIALSMEFYDKDEVPHYRSSSGSQLGPIAVGWVPEHYVPAANDLPFVGGSDQSPIAY